MLHEVGEHLGGIQVSRVCHGSGVIAVVPVFDDGVKEVGKHLEGTSDKVKRCFQGC